MELYKELLIKALEQGNIEIKFDKCNLNEIVESHCYILLNEIKTIINDSSLSDKECFEKIEKIICLFEDYNISCGIRHDF